MMVVPRLMGRSSTPDRELYLAVLDDVREWPAVITEPRPGFVALTALDTSGSDAGDLGMFAEKLLDQGCRHTVAWGPDANRLHLAFDLVSIERDERGASTIDHLPTDEVNGSLGEALWRAVFVAFPDFGEYGSVLVVVGPELEAITELRLRDPDDLWNWDEVSGESGAEG